MRVSDHLELKLQETELPNRVLGPNPGLQQEQQVLTTDPPLQPTRTMNIFNKCILLK